MSARRGGKQLDDASAATPVPLKLCHAEWRTCCIRASLACALWEFALRVQLAHVQQSHKGAGAHLHGVHRLDVCNLYERSGDGRHDTAQQVLLEGLHPGSGPPRLLGTPAACCFLMNKYMNVTQHVLHTVWAERAKRASPQSCIASCNIRSWAPWLKLRMIRA